MAKKKSKMVLGAIFFLSLQTGVELGFGVCHVLVLFFSKSNFANFVGWSWLIQYLLSFWSYVEAAFLNPGYFTEKLKEEFKRKKKSDVEYQNCDYCKSEKPKRCHHCKTCKKCVLLYDHHCDFIDNCIGYRNYKAFFLFLVIFTIHAVTVISIGVYSIVCGSKRVFDIITFFISALYFGIFGVMVVMQLYSQIPFLLHNMTCVEDSIQFKQSRFYRKANIELRPPFDNGIINNIKCRFGSNPLLWIFPIANNEYHFHYKVNPEYIPFSKVESVMTDECDDEQPLLLKPVTRRIPHI